ncbi:SDR family NAD(P)-dependent oxidoreductase [Luminiphilus sp.]|nr:SDR family NAD(P)-dependent oxidoreductase [Luminiphilus sp.]MDA9711125.1 SDR family NAD(P)-dependent oxidoreductase [Luminiphilus sp.]
MAAKKTCLVIGAGAGIGGSVGKKFAGEGYHAALCRRSDIEGLNTMVSGLQEDGMSASGHLLNAVDEGALESLIEEVEAIGPIDTVLYNLGAQIGNRSLDDTPLKTFELGWRMACFGLFRVAKVLVPRMVERGHGTILVTSATAAVRGNRGQHSHTAAMAGRRLLCQSLNAEYAARGVHVVHILIDGAVDAPDTLGKMLGPENFEALREAKGKGKDGLLLPQKIAETYYHLAQQHRSAWTHELDLRAHSDLAWWNHAVNL